MRYPEVGPVLTSKYTDMHRLMGCGTYFIFRPKYDYRGTLKQ
jgi:hypothetical protein